MQYSQYVFNCILHLQTYCIESGECVPLDECIEHDSDSNDQCGNGSCQVKKLNIFGQTSLFEKELNCLQQCPRPEEIETNADFSSCIIDGHCDEGQKCCLDQGKTTKVLTLFQNL